MYNVSGGKTWTPKHLGLACTLHQATRSKGLVQLFHNAGHIISYDGVLQVDTALAESTVKSMNNNTGAVIPPNPINNRFVYFSCDNMLLVTGWKRYLSCHTGYSLAFHALTGSDVTSFLSGHSNKTAWKVFGEHHDLGEGVLAKETIAETEKFVCRLYNTQDVLTVDKARSQLFMKFRSPESLPPTSDALSFHIMRSHYQETVWRQAHVNYPDIPPPQDMDWKEEDGKILPVLMSLPPVPKASSRVLNSFHVGAPPRV